MLFGTEDEFAQFISCVNDFRDKTVFAFLYLTGCGKGEALALRWKDINLETRLVDIHATLTKTSDSPFVFGSENTIFFSFSTLEHAFKRYIKKSKVKAIRIHDLRHSHVSLLINKGGNQLAKLYVIAARIGDSVEMVLKTYGHMFLSTQKDIIERLNIDF